MRAVNTVRQAHFIGGRSDADHTSRIGRTPYAPPRDDAVAIMIVLGRRTSGVGLGTRSVKTTTSRRLDTLLNDGFGADSCPSPGNPCRSGIRPERKFLA